MGTHLSVEQKTFITIYMVHKGGHPYFKDAIESVLNQRFRELEFLLVDDGIDHSDRDLFHRLMERSPDIEFEVIENHGRGLLEGCRAALHRAKGEWIIRLDSDDVLEREALNELLYFAKNGNYDLVFPDYFEIDENGSNIRLVTNQVELASLVDAEFHGACCLARTSQLIEIGAYSTKANRQDGFDVLVKTLLHKKNIGHLEKPLFNYRRHSSNISSNELMLSRARNQILIEAATSLDWKNHKSAILIPFRNNKSEDFALRRFKGPSILEKLMEDISKSRLFSRRVLAVQEVSQEINVIGDKFEVEVIKVPSFPTIAELIEHAKAKLFPEINSLVSATVNFPFRNQTCYDAAISKLRIFGYYKMFSAIKVEGNVYRLGANGMEYFGSRRELRINRDRLYIESGGLIGVSFTPSVSNVSTVKVGSFVMASIEATEIRNAMTLELLNLNQKGNI